MADPKPPGAVAEPRFTNVARVRHSQSEFYVDFAILSLDQPGLANLVSALVMTPQHAKQLVRALTENIEKFESKHGEIEIPPPKGTVQ